MRRSVAALGVLAAACAPVAPPRPPRAPVVAPARPPGAVELPTSDPTSFRASAWTVPATLALHPGIAGHVRDGSGAELPGAVLILTDPVHLGPEQVQVTDDHGAFAYALPHGTYDITVYAYDVTIVLDPLTTGTDTTTELDLVIAPGPIGGEPIKVRAD